MEQTTHARLIEPARFGRTGFGLGTHKLRPEFSLDGLTYGIDAPEFIATGGARSEIPGVRYIVMTVAREQQ
jgi:hypothetical protein